jgi:hypothetical protein
MGQQQLLLLVLATVIVGLATVAGIQAFDERQGQASQDALVQRGTSIGSNVKGLAGRPSQMGGIDINGDGSGSDSGIAGGTLADRLGYDHSSGVVSADGAGSNGRCEIKGANSGVVTIACTSDEAPQDVEIQFDPSADPQISTSFGSYTVANS